MAFHTKKNSEPQRRLVNSGNCGEDKVYSAAEIVRSRAPNTARVHSSFTRQGNLTNAHCPVQTSPPSPNSVHCTLETSVSRIDIRQMKT